MRVINFDHITLHAEAIAALAEAETAGWERPSIHLFKGDKYPGIAFTDETEKDRVYLDTNPNYMDQTIYFDSDGNINYIEIRYNRPVVSLVTAQAMIALVKAE
jgi:hypothetical protein